MKRLFCLLATLVFFSCHSRRGAILNSFKQVDSALQKSNRDLAAEDSLSFFYLSIQAKGSNNKEEAAKADALYQAAQETIDLLQRTINLLQKKDPTSDDTEAATRLLVHTPLGDSIRTAIARVAFRCRDALIATDNRRLLDMSLKRSMEVIDEEKWNQQFTGERTGSAEAMLGFFGLQCRSAAKMVLEDIADHP